MKKNDLIAFLSVSLALYAVLLLICFAISALELFPLVSPTKNISFFNFRAEHLISLSQYPALARCFFKNSPIFDTELFETLRQTGLLHLVAISGGQVRLFIDFGVRAPLKIWLHFTRHVLKTRHAILTTQKFFLFLEPALSGFIVVFFGFSGSLQRVWMLHYLVHNNWFRTPALKLSTIFPQLSLALLGRCLSLLVLSLLFGNPWVNLSFLLSATGSGLASFVHSRHVGDHPMEMVVIFLTQTILTSLLTAIILMPLAPINILACVAANTLCLPLVNLFLVPAAMFLLFFPLPLTLTKVFMSAFDGGLGLFFNMAQNFGLTEGAKAYDAWPDWAHFYLGSLTIFIWLAHDARAQQLRFRLRFLVLRGPSPKSHSDNTAAPSPIKASN